MTFEEFVIVYLIALALFAVLDALWLGSIAKDLYKHFLKRKMASPPVWPAAIAFYLLFVAGLIYFAVIPGIEAKNPSDVAINGALYGFFTYMTYGLTSLSTLKGWPGKLAAVDIAWGTVACFTASILTYVIYFGVN